ncbi:Uncharacterized protein dnm_013200 [Desulfonema magnum]|uniref:Uncharacterized protein n=1 Tax=Desulfonema magnum TaxID=45655 RepID=A0A975BHV1_9BACT|nr:Uncharacterized protein dnm_013200 [Desulfonema magnum]
MEARFEKHPRLPSEKIEQATPNSLETRKMFSVPMSKKFVFLHK